MPATYKISVITPSFNSSKYLEEAVESVLKQEYPSFEHIVVDGGSTDNTLDILRKYEHLVWISEPDEGQSDAMNKGFKMSTGDIIVYLNADDYFLPGAFKRIIPYFQAGAKFVMGNVEVHKNGTFKWLNSPKITHDEMLRHWEKNAFCVNPVGYFYLREVQENVPGFNKENHFAMDLEFLLECSLKYDFTKIDREDALGVFRYHEDAKTAKRSEDIAQLFKQENFSFIDKFVSIRDQEFIREYNQLRSLGYQKRIKKFQKTRSRNLKSKPRKKLKIRRKVIEFLHSKSKLEIIRLFFKRYLS